MNRALFLDLDDTLITTKSGKKFPINIDDWKFVDGMIRVIDDALFYNYKIIIVTNQGGIGLGIVKEEDFLTKMQNICAELERKFEGKLKLLKNLDFYYCTSNIDEDYMRKPNPGMAHKAAIDHELLLHESVMIGDASGHKGRFSASDYNFRVLAGIGKFADPAEAPSKSALFISTTRRLRKTWEEEEEDKRFWEDFR